MLANDQRKNSGVGATTTAHPSGSDTIGLRWRNVCSSLDLFPRASTGVPGCGMLLLGLAPGLDRVAAVQPAGERAGIPPASRCSSRIGDRQQTIERRA